MCRVSGGLEDRGMNEWQGILQLCLDVLNSITNDEPSIFSFFFFSVFTEKTQLSHVSKVKYFLINLILMMFCDCKFPVKFHIVWFVCSNLCSISFVFGKPCKSPGTWASPGLFVICFD